MIVSVIIPVFNERGTVKAILDKVCAVPLEKEIVIVDDGSTDGTREVLKEIIERHPEQREGSQSKNQIKVILKDKNEGKGSAVRVGIKAAAGGIIIIQDADLEYDPADYPALISPLVEGKAQVVYGSRILGGSAKSSLGFYLGGRLLTIFTNFLYRTGITDEPTCYKVFCSRVIKGINLRENGFEFCPEVTAKIHKAGYRIREVPIHYYPRDRKEGKKIRPIDGIKALWTLIKYRFVD